MAEALLEHMHEDLESMKKDVALIKHFLLEEGELTEEAKRRLEEARRTPDAEYKEL